MNSKTKTDRLIKQIEKACAGLVYISETDAEIIPVTLGPMENLTAANMLSKLNKTNNEPIEEASSSNFFNRLTTKHDWHTSVDKNRTRQFEKLRSILEKNLNQLKIFRIGKIQIDIYAIGKTADGIVAGIKTSAVET